MAPSTRGARMEHVYFALALVGFIVPGVPMLIETFATGNILFWTDPARTVAELFANRTSTAFALDVMLAVVFALTWITHESRRLAMRGAWRFWVLAALFGLAGPLPLFLGLRERALARQTLPSR